MITLESIKEAVSNLGRGCGALSCREGSMLFINETRVRDFFAKSPAYIKWLIERVEELEKCVELANQRAELTNEIMTGATANVNEIRTLKADLAKYKKLEDAAREVYNAYIEATPHDTDFDWGSWGNKMDKALKEIGEAIGRGVDRNEPNGLQNEKLQAATSAMCGENYFLKEKNEKLKKVAERLEKDYEHAKKLYGEQQGLYQDTFQEFEKFKAMQTVIKTYK